MSRDDQALASDSALTTEHRPAKRPKMSQARKAKTSFADRSLDNHEDSKRQKTISKPTASEQTLSDNMQQQLETIVNTIEKSLPRVGKQMIDQRNIIDMIQAIFPIKPSRGSLHVRGPNEHWDPLTTCTRKKHPCAEPS